MRLETKNFGTVEVDDNKLITFEEGLPGFLAEKEYVILRDSEEVTENDLFCWLQSVQNGDLAFAMMNVFPVIEDYDPLIDEEELKTLGEAPDEDYLIYNIVVIPDDLQKMRVNLRAPVIINTATRRGKQFVCSNEEYSLRHYLFAQPDSPLPEQAQPIEK